MEYKVKPAEERFWSKVNKTDTCWWWLAGKRSGYGHFSIKYVEISAHRFSWELAYGSIPVGLHVLHKCDNRLCVRPDHLFLGTNADNMADRNKKNRQAKGERNGYAKLTQKEVDEIRSDSRPSRAIAKEYGICFSTICLIKSGKRWRD